MKKILLSLIAALCLVSSVPVLADSGEVGSSVAIADANTVYYLYVRTNAQEAWRFWAGYHSLKEAQDAEYEAQSYGYETFIKKSE